MKFFKCYAVMPLLGHERTHAVKTYIVAAECREGARALVLDEAPGAEFVTMPVETPAVLMVEVMWISEREFADLRTANGWREQQRLPETDLASGGPPN
jgi:hypothetical protein